MLESELRNKGGPWKAYFAKLAAGHYNPEEDASQASELSEDNPPPSHSLNGDSDEVSQPDEVIQRDDPNEGNDSGTAARTSTL